MQGYLALASGEHRGAESVEPQRGLAACLGLSVAHNDSAAVERSAPQACYHPGHEECGHCR